VFGKRIGGNILVGDGEERRRENANNLIFRENLNGVFMYLSICAKISGYHFGAQKIKFMWIIQLPAPPQKNGCVDLLLWSGDCFLFPFPDFARGRVYVGVLGSDFVDSPATLISESSSFSG